MLCSYATPQQEAPGDSKGAQVLRNECSMKLLTLAQEQGSPAYPTGYEHGLC